MIALPQGRPLIMGILNVTPDSFSDGGQFASVEAAVAAGLRMRDEGADCIDVGGESTRPGAEPVPLDEELRRVLPVVAELAARRIAVSIDTQKPEVARAACAVGARLINDVSGLRNPLMAEAAAETGAGVCIMHMQGEPQTMQQSPTYGDVVEEVRSWLLERAEQALAAGVDREKIWLDPGIGFGKTTEHNLTLLRRMDRLVDSGFPILLGVSRKAFIGRILGSPEHPLPTSDRLEGTLAIQAFAQLAGVRALRVHDVREARRVAEMLAALTPLEASTRPV